MVVCLEEQIHIYDVATMKLLHTIDTVGNIKGLAALSSTEQSTLAYPATEPGQLLLFDSLNSSALNIIKAHKSAIGCISFNSTGSLVATASEKGTVIRVFSSSGDKMYQFRRGTYTAIIQSIVFSLDDKLLAVSSFSDTVHLFKLSNDHGYTNRLISATHAVGSLVPRISDMLEPNRDFSHAKIPLVTLTQPTSTTALGAALNHSIRSVCAFGNSTQRHAPLLLVATSAGFYYQFEIDLVNGGECRLLKEYSLVE